MPGGRLNQPTSQPANHFPTEPKQPEARARARALTLASGRLGSLRKLTQRNDRHPAPGDRHPATGTRRPATGTRRPATGTRRSPSAHGCPTWLPDWMTAVAGCVSVCLSCAVHRVPDVHAGVSNLLGRVVAWALEACTSFRVRNHVQTARMTCEEKG